MIVSGGTIYTPLKKIENGVILIEDKKIKKIGSSEDIKIHREKKIKTDGKIIVPGFIDLHIHGAKGFDVMDANYDALNNISKTLAQFGTTSFLATTLTASLEDIFKAIRGINFAKKKGTAGAKILGVYLEGPYISYSKKGAQPPQYIRTPDVKEIENIIKEGNIKIVAIAPELKGSKEVIEYLKNKKIIVACGHSDGTYEEILRSIDWGITQATHTFCAMSGMHHRAPGAVGAILNSDKVIAELIADGIHVHPPVMKLLVKIKGIQKIVLITDAIAALGLPEGEYNLYGRKIIYKNGAVRLDENTLAGSALSMNKAIENMVKLVGLSLRESLFIATLNPARVLGIDKQKGSLEVGKDADIVIMDKEFNVKKTIVEGKVVFERN